ncbi:MAG: hypothetical protein ISS79_14160 [Phycisphaerae bacterium]|nr:hypothetical protein [Phycisphaerae bacterium]
MIRKFLVITLILLAGGCGSPKNPVWHHPQKTLEEAEEDIKRCYFEAFLAKQDTVIHGITEEERDPRRYIEATACKCMKQSGYRQKAAQRIRPPLRLKGGTAHTMPYLIAGR